MRSWICIVLLAIGLGMVGSASAQPLPDSLVRKIDNLFSKWNSTSSPGVTVGIVRNDSLIFAKGYGMANLEYGIPNAPSTPYHMASISKQFTAYAIVLLARQGKLSLEDDVSKWLPWFPDLKEKITIRHLLNHTSGIRDQWQLLAISGTRLDDIITQEHIVKILSQQKALNFKPGAKYSYSNSGFTMLAEIVKEASGRTLRQFTDSAIFKPLGMTNTHFHDDASEIEKGRSYSYDRKSGGRFSNSILSYSVAGATSLFTNVDDMSKWVVNLYAPKVGDFKDIETLTQNGRLNNGKALSYALGIVSDKYKGWRQYSHSGGDAGYRTYLTVFPDLKMGFIVFSNLGDVNPGGPAYAMADLFVKDTLVGDKRSKMADRDGSAAILKDSVEWKKYAGDYIGDEGFAVSVEMKYGQLHYRLFGQTGYLIREKADTFSMAFSPEVKFVFGIKGKDTTVDVVATDQFYHVTKYISDTSRSVEMLKAYTGTYYCPELDCKYGIALKGKQLVLTNAKYSDVNLTLVGTEHLTNENWWMNHLMMKRDAKGKIIGFEVNSGRIEHLEFRRL